MPYPAYLAEYGVRGGRSMSFAVSQIELSYTVSCIGERDSNGCALAVRDFLPGLVANSYCLARHRNLLPISLWDSNGD